MKRIFLAFCVAALVPALTFAQADLQPAAIVKLTKTEPITVKQLKVEVAKLEEKANRALTAEERRQVLDVMINERLAMQGADRDKIVVTDGEINQQIQQARSSMASSLGRLPTDMEFDAALKNETGGDLSAYKERLKKELTVQKYLVQKKKALFDSLKNPSEAEISEAYELSKAKLVRPDTIRFSMIFIPIGTDAGDRAKAKTLADKLSSEIANSGSKFDEVLIRSQVAGSNYQGGDGGYLPKTAEAQKVVGSEFMTVGFSLSPGQVSRVLENPKGFQIIKVTETYTQKTLELNDPYQLGSRPTVREYLGNLIAQQRQQRVIDAATKELVSELRAGNSFQVYDKNLNW
ncbi:membrane protein [Treponema sp.]